MTRLLRVELFRARSRTAPWLALVGLLAVVAIALYGVHTQAAQVQAARSGTDSALVQAQRDWDAHGEQMVADCRSAEEEERQSTGNATIDLGCDDMHRPTAEEFYGSVRLDQRLHQLLGDLAYPLMFLALAIGSTLVAAEYVNRTLGTWLTFEPRRTSVFLSKVLAPAVLGVPLAVLGIGLALLGTPLVLRLHGLDASLDSVGWASLGWRVVRVTALTAAAGAAGAALAFVLRHSAAVLGVVVGYLLVFEGILSQTVPGVGRLLLAHNVQAVVDGGTGWTTWEQECTPTMGPCDVQHRLSLTHGVVELTVLLVLAGVLAWALFRTRDVD